MASFAKRGDKILAQVRITQGGVQVFAQARSFETMALAKSWATKLEAKIKKDGVPSAAATQRITVGGVIERQLAYIEGMKPVGRSLVATYTTMSQEFAGLSLADATPKHFMDFAARRRKGGVAPATVLSDLSAVSASLNAAPYSIGIETTEAAAAMKIALARMHDAGTIGKSRSVIRVMDAQEEAALMAEFARTAGHHQTTIDMLTVLRLAVAFPRRASELTRIRWADIDPKRRTVIIRDVKHPTKKAGNDQVVPLLGPAWDIIQALPRTDDRILPYDTQSMLTAYARARKRIAKAGMPGILTLRFNDATRHTGITRLLKMKMSIPDVAIVSGHTNWKQVQRYANLSADDVHENFDLLIQAKAPSPPLPAPAESI